MTTIPTQTSVESERPRANLKQRFIFLSASFPSKEQSPNDYSTADAAEISQAIVAVTRAVLSSKGRLVFGGHPTVTPLILTIAQEYLPQDDAQRRAIREKGESLVVAYQSEVFNPFVPAAIRKLEQFSLGEIVETKKAPGESPRFTPTGKLIPGTATESLQAMRIEMIQSTKPLAAFFIGGMQGISDEAETCRKNASDCHLFYLGAPGGAARRLAERNSRTMPRQYGAFANEMLTSRNYPALIQNLMRILGGGDSNAR